MRRPSFFQHLMFWNGNIVRPSAASRPRPKSSPRPPARFTPQQLDRLYDGLMPGLGEAPPDGPSVWDDEGAAMIDRQARFLRTVDRAIAEIATGRGRSRGFDALASLRRPRRPSEAASDPRCRTRTGPRRRPS